MDMPSIKSVTPAPNMSLHVEWTDGGNSTIQLIGWVATGGDALSELLKPEMWQTAYVTDYGATIEWGVGDLAIDAYHVFQIAEDQREFKADDLDKWHNEMGLSSNEAADFLGISVRTWKNYRAGYAISNPMKMLLRASQRDPLMMYAHYRPRQNGRPKSAT